MRGKITTVGIVASQLRHHNQSRGLGLSHYKNEVLNKAIIDYTFKRLGNFSILNSSGLSMKKIILGAMIMIASFSYNAYAKTVSIAYSGVPVSKEVQLSTGDVVMINTTIEVGTRILIRVTPIGNVNKESFKFTSSMENVSPYRTGSFLDQLYTGSNPGWVSYTYTGKDDISARFNLNP